jgi:myo-inositol 2-dehydrogenase / D-chiro-inositol 1-dehydrogenase
VTLRVAVLGVGRIGRMHAELLQRRVEGASLAAVYDEDRRTASAVGARLAVRVGRSVQDVLAAADVDAVAICSPTPTHAELIVAAAEAGKAIFCEKPVSLDLAQVDCALTAVELACVPFQLGFNRRFDPADASVAAAVAAGEIGEPHLVRISSRERPSGRAPLVIGLAARRSLREGRSVRIEEVDPG